MAFFPKFRRSQAGMKRMYNRINRLYSSITGVLGPKLTIIVDHIQSKHPDLKDASVLEYACGTGLLSLRLAPYCRSLTAKDQSAGMLAVARERAAQNDALPVTFCEGDILAITEADHSYDYAFVSFALHLFPLEQEIEILRNLCRVARKAVVIIDHERTWRPMVALVEWIEGGYYDQFLKTDFGTLWPQTGAVSFEEDEIAECRVMCFHVVPPKGWRQTTRG